MIPRHVPAGFMVILAYACCSLGWCSTPPPPHYQCGEEGVQLRVPPGQLGHEVKFQVRDEFEMGYDLSGCLSKCLFETKDSNGESVFYSPYTICLSTRQDGVWRLRVRLIGSLTSEDIDLICPKPKIKKPRVISRTHKPRRTTWLTTLSGQTVTQDLATTTLPSDTFTQIGEERRTTKSVDADDPTLQATNHHQMEYMHSTTSGDPLYNWLQILVSSPTQTTVPTPTTEQLVTVNCYPDGNFSLLLSRYVTNPPLKLEAVVLDPGTCPSPTMKADFLEFKGHIMTCSNHRLFQGHLVYELYLSVKPNILVSYLGSITRDSSLKVFAQCSYNTSISLSLAAFVGSPPPLPSVSNTGELNVELRISKGSSFSSFYSSMDFPLEILLGELVFLEARLLQPSDPRLHLRLHHCWGAPSVNSSSTIQWSLLYDGCPYIGDHPMTKLLPEPVPSSYQRFVISAFTFVGFSNNTQVYIFCSVSVCLPSLSETCISDCGDLAHRVQRSVTDDSLYFVSTPGPLIFKKEKVSSGWAGLQHLTPAFSGIFIAVTFLLVLLFVTGSLTCSCFTTKFRVHL